MENGEPEVNFDSPTIEGTTVNVSADFHHTRNCADCSTELKSVDDNVGEEFDIEDTDEFKALPEDDRKSLKEALTSGEAEVEVEDDGSDASEGGGGRYAKNIITVTAPFTATVTCGEKTFAFKGELKMENAASNYEECC